MSRIAPIAHSCVTTIRRSVAQSRLLMAAALDEADALLCRMAKDKQCDDEDILAIADARADIARVRKDNLG
jgi:hypothetical protein